MKNRRVLLLLLLLANFQVISQTPELNLAKYWNYRSNLKSDFLVAGDPEDPGSYIPAGNRNQQAGVMQWGDATWYMGHYLCVLATEYRLLKDNNQDLSEIEAELTGLIQSLNRLDLTAETYFGGTASLNGFFLRDDVPQNYHQHFPGINVVTSDFQSSSGPRVMSQDQVWSLLVGLALVKKLVDDPAIKAQAQDMAYRFVDAMNYTNSNGISLWEIINPVTGEVVQPNSDVGILCYGFGEAGSWVSDQNCHFGLSETGIKKSSFDIAQATILFFVNAKQYNIFGIEALSTVGDINYTDYGSLYDWLVYVYDQSGFHIHFPLVYQILHGFDGTGMIDESVLTDLLDSAPFEGPYYYDENNHSPEPWDRINLIANPWQDPANFPGRYNGLDYMLLYNLTFLVYQNEPVPYRKVTPAFPLQAGWQEFEAGAGSQQDPVTIESSRLLEAESVINNNGDVTLKAGTRIVLKPGFHAISGSYFKGLIDSTLQQEVYYTQPESGSK